MSRFGMLVLPVSNAMKVASYILFFTWADSRSRMAVVTICPLVRLMDSHSAGSFSFEYLKKHKDKSIVFHLPFCVYKSPLNFFFLTPFSAGLCAHRFLAKTHTHTHLQTPNSLTFTQFNSSLTFLPEPAAYSQFNLIFHSCVPGIKVNYLSG